MIEGHGFGRAFFLLCVLPNWNCISKYILVTVPGERCVYTISSRRPTSGECCQWVLDVACKPIEWPRQPLGFESLTLRSHSIGLEVD